MNQILIGTILISVLHAIIPSHWLPVLAIGRRHGWSEQKVTTVTLISGLAHAVSTVLIGLLLGLVGVKVHASGQRLFHVLGPSILILLGIFFIYQHYRHKHFHLHQVVKGSKSQARVLFGLVLAMFFSPCIEIEGYFLLAGAYGWWLIASLAVLYTVISVTGMVIWVRLAYKGMIKMDWHKIEHNSGIITGMVLILTGILSFFLY